MATDEEVLTGGNTHGSAVVRVGDTVRRPTGEWTPSVHRLLNHLHGERFTNAPRVMGIDEHQREILNYVPGDVVWPDNFACVTTDGALADVARVVRAFHDASQCFVASTQDRWCDHGRDPAGAYELICHNDLAPWNLVHGAKGYWTFIDWDLAAPGRRVWDIAWAVLNLVPLMPAMLGVPLDRELILHRLRVFETAYGVDAYPNDVLEVAAERCARESGRISQLGAMGEAPYAKLLSEGHAQIWSNAEIHVRANIDAWRP